MCVSGAQLTAAHVLGVAGILRRSARADPPAALYSTIIIILSVALTPWACCASASQSSTSPLKAWLGPSLDMANYNHVLLGAIGAEVGADSDLFLHLSTIVLCSCVNCFYSIKKNQLIQLDIWTILRSIADSF